MSNRRARKLIRARNGFLSLLGDLDRIYHGSHNTAAVALCKRLRERLGPDLMALEWLIQDEMGWKLEDDTPHTND